jgi:HPt (histidine-containing phosphotransfer) domain-containing protein
MASSKELKTLDWEGALRQVSDDREFLNEVLDDLIVEALTAQADIEKHIEGLNTAVTDETRCSHFSEIRKAAHRIKGSAAYLCCEMLIDVSFKLQEAGHQGSALECTTATSHKIESHVDSLFVLFKKCVVDIQAEILKNAEIEKTAEEETTAEEVVETPAPSADTEETTRAEAVS